MTVLTSLFVLAARACCLRSTAKGVALSSILVAGLAQPISASAAETCAGPKPVCDVRGAVFPISSFDPFGSAVRIGPDLLVTNRHVVADEATVKVSLPDGTFVTGQVLPTAYRGDLILMRVKLPPGPVMALADVSANGALYTVGYDLSLRRVRTYPAGALLAPVLADKPFARIHHSAYTQPGNSGGALVNAQGQLVGIVTAGGAGRFDAFPVRAVRDLQARSGAEFGVASTVLGKAYRSCVLALEKRGPTAVTEVLEVCPKTSNRQYLDLAAQRAGAAGQFEPSLALSKAAIERDPNSINSLVSIVETFRFARRAKDALPYATRLLSLVPKDDRVLAMAAMIGKFGEDQALVDKAVALVKQHHPSRMPFIERMLQQPLRR